MKEQTELVEAFTQGLPQGAPVGLILVEGTEFLSQSIDYYRRLGVEALVLLDRRPGQKVSLDGVLHLPCQAISSSDFVNNVNTLLPVLSQRWVSLGFQCEFLCFPFQESRNLLDFIAFMEEERRTAVYSMVLDLYAANPQLELSWENAAFDRLGYYSEPVFEEGEVQERQAALYGGVRWRLEDHIPWEDRRLDRISLFQSIPGRTVTPELRLSDAEGNTRACPWHHNATVALASFRSALSLARNPQSATRAKDLTCPVSLPFEGTSQQLMTHGFLEPGQWF